MAKWLLTFFTILMLLGHPAGCLAAFFSITSGGTPTITGASGGSVIGNSDVTTSLAVTINFGEISPSNRNSYVKVTVPIAIRSDTDYSVSATVTGGTNVNTQALQRSDIGFGVMNMRAMGGKSKVCTRSSHTIYSPFNNDPSLTMFTSATGRIAYPSDLADVPAGTVLLSGPILSENKQTATDNGYIFDTYFVIAPQFFANGSTSATITFSISNGFNAPC